MEPLCSLGDDAPFSRGAADRAEDAPKADGLGEDVSLDLVERQGRVRLCDHRDGRQSIAHVVTHERLLLPEGDRWSLVFDDQGYGCVISASRSIVLEDVFCKALYEREGDGALFIRQSSDGTIWSLTDRMRQYKSGHIEWGYGVGHTAEMRVFALSWHRQGFAMCWSLHSLYKLAGLSCYKRLSSKWVYESQGAWEKYFDSLGIVSALIKSSHCGDGPDYIRLTSTTSFLPIPCLTTAGFLAVLFRFLNPSPQKGGLRQEKWQHILSLISGLFHSLAVAQLPGGGWTLEVYFDGAWVYKWPASDSRAPDLLLQVDIPFDATAEGQDAAKKEALAQEQNRRHELWRRRGRGSSTAAGWRPKKVYRRSAKKLLMAIDNQVRRMTEWHGLNRFQLDRRLQVWQHWKSWPHIVLTMDRGSDNFSAGHSLLYFEPVRLNASLFWDPSHDAWRSVLEAVKSAGLQSFMMLIMVCANLPHGPDSTDMRFVQMQAASKEIFDVHSWRTSSLFKEFSRAMMNDLGDDLPVNDQEPREETLWNYLRDFALFSRKGYKANLSRFQSVIVEGRRLLKRWWCAVFVMAFTAIECDMLKGKRLCNRFVLRTGGADVDAPVGRTGAAGVDDKAIKNVAQNALVISLLTMCEAKHQRMLKIVVHGAMPVTLWHQEQNVKNRDVLRAEQWIVSQTMGAYMKHVESVLLGPNMEANTVECGFAGSLDMSGAPDEALQYEDELASLYGVYTTSLAVARMKRFLSVLISWPWSMARVLSDREEVARSCVQELKRHAELHDALQNAANPTKHMKQIADRSVFHQVSVQQLRAACEEANHEASDDLKSMMQCRCRSILGTQLVEDYNNVMKNDRSMSGNPRPGTQHYRRPETSFAAGLTRDVACKMHRFGRTEIVEPAVQKSGSLDPSAFSSGKGSLKFNAVESTTPTAPFYSPAPGNACTPAADHSLLDLVVREGRLPDVGFAWRGAFAGVSRNLVFRFDNPIGEAEWYWALYHFPGSSVLVWPVEVLSGRLTGGCDIVVPKTCTAPKLVPVLSYVGVSAFTFSWRSWAWQQRRLVGSALRPGVRQIREANSPIQPILKVLARNGWFDLPKSTILDMCEGQGYIFDEGIDLFEVLVSATAQVLDLGEAEATEFIRGRFARLPANHEIVGDLLEVDEACACLEEPDRLELKRQQQEVYERQKERESLAAAFKAQRERSGTAANGAKKRKVATASVPYKGPRKVPPGVETLQQVKLREMMPPGGYIWVARNISAWCTRLPPQRTFTAPWRRYDSERASALAAIRDVWARYLEKEGRSIVDCPITDLFGGSAAPPSGQAASSSTA